MLTKNTTIPRLFYRIDTFFTLIILVLFSVMPAKAGTYTYRGTAAGTYDWSTDANWDAIPVSASDTILRFSGDLAGGTDIVVNNDIAGNFLMNKLDFFYTNAINTAPAPTLTITGNALEFSGASAVIYYVAAGTTLANRPGLIIDSNIILSTNLNVFINNSRTSAEVILNGMITGSGYLRYTGAGSVPSILILSNPGNDYTGDTQMYLATTSQRNHVVRLGASDVIPNGPGKGNLFFNCSGEAGWLFFDLFGFDETINGLASSTSIVPNFHIVRNMAATASTLTIGDNDTSANFVGLLQNGGSGALNVVKIGAGTQTFAGQSTYTGTTTVENGTLKLDHTQIGVMRTGNPTNFFSTNSVLVLSDGATFHIEGQKDGEAYYEADYFAPANVRNLIIPNADAAGLVPGQPITLTKVGDVGNLYQATNAYYITRIDPPGALTTVVYLNSRIANGNILLNVDIPATIATTEQTIAGLTLSGAADSNAFIDFGFCDNLALTFKTAPIQIDNGSRLTIMNWQGNVELGGGGDRLIFVGNPDEFKNVFSQREVTFDGYYQGYALIDYGGYYEVTARFPPNGTVVSFW